MVIAPLGSPRILIAHPPTLARYRSLVNTGAPSAVRFKAMVDRQVGGASIYAFAPWYAALMGQITGQASYCTYAVSRTDNFVASEELLINSNQRATVAYDSYLEVGPTIGNVAMVYDWCRSAMTDAQRARWRAYANQAVWNVWNHQNARWGTTSYAWTGWSVDNPSNNYYYSFLQATMLLGLATHGENAQAQDWIHKFRTEKIQSQLVPTFTRDLQGGGSREGTGYGTALMNLWQLYDWWEKSTTERIADLTPHTRASIPAMLHSIVPTLDRLTPTGDHARDETAQLFDYHRAYLQTLMRLYPNDRVSGAARSLLAASSVQQMSQPFMYVNDFLYDTTDIPAEPLAALGTAYWASGSGQFSMRGAWTRDAVYSNLICGPYSESHAHRDQGSFTLYRGAWLAQDANIDSRSGIVQDEAFHNLVRFFHGSNEVRQGWNRSCDMLALDDNATYSYGLARVTPMYGASGSVAKWEREYLFIKPATVVVFDRVSTASGVRRVFSMNLPGMPSVAGNAAALTVAGKRLDVTAIAPANLTLRAQPWAALGGPGAELRAGNTATLLEAEHAAGTDTAFLNVLATDQSVTQASPSHTAAQTGVELRMADGRTVLLRFGNTATGGQITVRNPQGVVTLDQTLQTTVQTLPLMAM